MNVEGLRKKLHGEIDGYTTDIITRALTQWIQSTGIPEIKLFAADYIEALMKHGNTESGWSRFRDCVFLPAVINGAIWLAEHAVVKIIEETERERLDS